jgi:hypothetical protein
MALLLSLYSQQSNKDTNMKKSLFLIPVTIVLSSLADIKAQQKENTYAETNSFLVGKRHGTITVINRYSSINPESDKLVADRNPFLAEKRHGAVVF